MSVKFFFPSFSHSGSVPVLCKRGRVPGLQIPCPLAGNTVAIGSYLQFPSLDRPSNRTTEVIFVHNLVSKRSPRQPVNESSLSESNVLLLSSAISFSENLNLCGPKLRTRWLDRPIDIQRFGGEGINISGPINCDTARSRVVFCPEVTGPSRLLSFTLRNVVPPVTIPLVVPDSAEGRRLSSCLPRSLPWSTPFWSRYLLPDDY